MFERILVALDGSDDAQKALKNAVALARGTGARRIGLIHVRPSAGTLAYAYGYDGVGGAFASVAEGLQEAVEQAEGRSREILARAEAYVREQASETTEVVRHEAEGPVVRGIIDAVRAGDYDALVIGSRGMGRAAGLLMGSVSQTITANLPCSVLIVESEEAAAEAEGERPE